MKITYENKYVAFLDVLGFSALVETNDVKKLEIYFTAIETAFKIFDNDGKQMNKISVSDSIILTVSDTEQNFLELLKAISFLQAFLAPYGIWMRGGISFGEVFEDKTKNIIVGKGYIKAYRLEEEQAIYPRVIIDPSILAKMNLNRQQFYLKCNGVRFRKALSSKVIHDYDKHKRYTQDDAIFICYANAVVLCFFLNNDKTLEEAYNHLRKGLYGEQKHYHKYLWLKKYFLECLEELSIESSFPYKVEISKFVRDFTAL